MTLKSNVLKSDGRSCKSLYCYKGINPTFELDTPVSHCTVRLAKYRVSRPLLALSWAIWRFRGFAMVLTMGLVLPGWSLYWLPLAMGMARRHFLPTRDQRPQHLQQLGWLRLLSLAIVPSKLHSGALSPHVNPCPATWPLVCGAGGSDHGRPSAGRRLRSWMAAIGTAPRPLAAASRTTASGPATRP